jgi:glycerophosphoryl diester phosphodiesterase
MINSIRFLSFFAALLAFGAAAAPTVWNFSNPTNRFAAASGDATLSYYDPDSTGWGPANTLFGKAAATFGLPTIPGGDPDVMRFPACTARQGYRIAHDSAPNGPYGETDAKVSNYTLIFDVLFPAASDGRWRALYQADPNNANDAEFYVQNSVGGGIGIIGVYNGSIRSNTWHRVAIVMQSAPGEGKCQRFIDGRFVGGIGSSGSALDIRWALDQAFLLLTDDDGETASGFLSSVAYADRAMTMEEIQALGGPHANGALTPGAPAPPLTHRMSRRVGVIGHRGGFFCCTPDNTMASVRYALSNNVPVIEIDMRLSADGVCVLVHDSTIDRTTDGTGAVASLTVAQLKQYDAGSWFSPEFAGERIPTLAEVMTEARGKMILYFDLKVPGQINAITNALAQTGFDPNDCWFWVYNNSADAASIRSRLPNAKIIWEAGGEWASDPNFFTNMRSIGVYAFDQGVYYGTVNTAFTLAAKQQGFVVSIYTILDPDTMVRNAAAGVDFMETDFPQIMNQIQPPPSNQASGPTPADGALNVSPNPTLTWVTATNATNHHIYFGTTSPPPFLRQQRYDLVPLTNLTLGATYYWRVDEATPTGFQVGPTWRFTVSSAPPPTNAFYEWTFDRADLAAAIGNGVMEYADGATAGLTTFGTTDGSTVPHIAGQPATYLHVPTLTGLNNGYFLSFTDSAANGGGAYMNRFTFIADVLVPGSLNWTALFNTNPENGNDADWYIDPPGRLGIGDLGYSGNNTVRANIWYRIAFVADLGAGVVTYYRNGAQVFQRTGLSLLDGRFSLYSNNDPGPDLLLFNEGDGSGVYTHELYAASIAFVDRNLTTTEISALGGAHPEGIFVRRLRISRTSTQVTLNWNGASNIRLQKATTLSPPNWQDLSSTLGGNTFSEPATGNGFYRLRRQ